MIDLLFSQYVFASALRLSIPILLAATGGAFTFHADIFNIALEGLMLISAFFSAWGAITFLNPWAGLFIGIFASVFMSFLFGFITIKLKANNIVAGLALNIGSLGLTTWLLVAFFGVRGVVLIDKNSTFSTIEIPLLSEVPFIGGIISGQNILVYIALAIVIFSKYFIYNNVFGLRLRAVGEHPEAVSSVGVKVEDYKIWSVLLSGIFCGLAGAFIAIGGSCMFSENMVAGKGFIALATVFFSQGRPPLIILASLLFGYTEAISVSLQQFGMPPQLMFMVPYVVTIIALTTISVISRRRGKLYD